jgi:hypothetical protein
MESGSRQGQNCICIANNLAFNKWRRLELASLADAHRRYSRRVDDKSFLLGSERRQDHSEDRTASVSLEQELALVLAHDCLLYGRAISSPGSTIVRRGRNEGVAGILTQSMSRKILRTLVNDPREDAKGQAWCPFIA